MRPLLELLLYATPPVVLVAPNNGSELDIFLVVIQSLAAVGTFAAAVAAWRAVKEARKAAKAAQAVAILPLTQDHSKQIRQLLSQLLRLFPLAGISRMHPSSHGNPKEGVGATRPRSRPSAPMCRPCWAEFPTLRRTSTSSERRLNPRSISAVREVRAGMGSRLPWITNGAISTSVVSPHRSATRTRIKKSTTPACRWNTVSVRASARRPRRTCVVIVTVISTTSRRSV